MMTKSTYPTRGRASAVWFAFCLVALSTGCKANRMRTTQAEFWGVRHFDRGQSTPDPTSPFGGQKSANLPDEQAIGLVFQCDPSKDRKATLTYLSSDKNSIRRVAEGGFRSSSEPEATAGLHIRHRELDLGVIESTYDLGHSQPLNRFLFVFMANLGHAVYV